MRRRLVLLVVAACAAIPSAATARTSATLDGGTIVFFSDTLALIARNGATIRLPDGTRGDADAAYVDLKNDRIVLAGHARLARGSAASAADAIALEMGGQRVDLLDAATGVTRTTRALGAGTAAEIDAQRFAFPDVDDRFAFIRSRHATIVAHANVRFTPASFPTSVGGVPVPSYLHSFATSAGFGATTLNGATFDQPYALTGTPTSLTSLHARVEGNSGALALQEQLASGDDAYVTAAVDAPLRGFGSGGITAYRRLSPRYNLQLGAAGGYGIRTGDATLSAAFGAAGGRLSYHAQSGGFSSFDASVRSPDFILPGRATFRLTADTGFDAQHGAGLYPYALLPDGRRYGSVWRHGLDAFLASPLIPLPLGATLTMSLDGSRTWYAFPRHVDAVAFSANASKTLTRSVSLFAGYTNVWNAQVFPNQQAFFYAPPALLPLAPDGTPFFGYNAYSGAAVNRYENFDVQIAPPNTTTSVRVSLRHASDFLQFDGYGRPLWEVRGDVRFRPFPNVGLAFGRTYDFGWGGRRWTPGWSFAITP
jgi:hypothetical protein